MHKWLTTICGLHTWWKKWTFTNIYSSNNLIYNIAYLISPNKSFRLTIAVNICELCWVHTTLHNMNINFQFYFPSGVEILEIASFKLYPCKSIYFILVLEEVGDAAWHCSLALCIHTHTLPKWPWLILS